LAKEVPKAQVKEGAGKGKEGSRRVQGVNVANPAYLRLSPLVSRAKEEPPDGLIYI
jgi:hypothetical protein